VPTKIGNCAREGRDKFAGVVSSPEAFSISHRSRSGGGGAGRRGGGRGGLLAQLPLFARISERRSIERERDTDALRSSSLISSFPMRIRREAQGERGGVVVVVVVVEEAFCLNCR